jgi:hypothetical protein
MANTKKNNPAPKASAPKAPTLSQDLKIAGTGGITKQELKTITEASGKSGGQVIQRLDALNQKLKGKDQTGINLNSGAANMLIKQAGPAYGGMYGLTQKPTFGTGRIGQTLEGMRGTRASDGPGTASRLMMGGTALRPGGREVVQGFGKQYGMPTSTKGPYDGMMDNLTGNDQGLPPPPTSSSIEPETLPELAPEEGMQPDININMDSLGSNLANWAPGFKTARSSRQRAGRKAQGLGQQRVSPTGSFRGSVG